MTSLSAESAEAALRGVLGPLDLDEVPVRLLGPVGDNAVFELAGTNLVVRISCGDALARVRRELDVARWLAKEGMPAVRLAEEVEQPITSGDLLITFWRKVEGISQGSTGEIGALLRRLHSLRPPSHFQLQQVDPFVRLPEHIDDAAGIPDSGKRFLRAELERLRTAYSIVEFTGQSAVIHGDAHRKNIVRDSSGMVLALDLERLGLGPVELDLSLHAVYRELGWYSERQYADFVASYGRDVMRWEGFQTLAAIRRLRMTSWLAARTGREPRLIPDALARIRSLQNPGQGYAWSPGV